MDMAQVIKVTYEGRMCRITATKSTNGSVISFAALEGRVRSSFKLSPGDTLSLTYTDNDGDIINLTSDDDIVDALVYQQLNPLRVDLAIVKAPGDGIAALGKGLYTSASDASSVSLETSSAVESEKSAGSASGEVADSQAVKDLVNSLEKQLRDVLGATGDVTKIVKEYEPLLKVAPAKIAEVFDAALKSGLAVSFEPIFEPGNTAVSSNVHTTPVDTVEPATVEESAVKEVAASGTLAEKAADDAVPAVLAFSAEASSACGSVTALGASAVASAPAAATAATSAGAAAGASTTAYPPVHHGIICDLCDSNPIVGLRYKSMVKHDYDLCESCFVKTKANPADYKCLTMPVFRSSRHSHPHFRGASWTSPCQPGGRPMRCGPPGPPGYGGRSAHYRSPPFNPGHVPAAEGKLEARFVTDVSIPDNMEVMPGSRFTKIWRMRNAGSIPWPQYTQIVHIGGDALGERNAVLLEMPEGGVLPQQEVDVSVDMVAPKKLGRYMSHWRLCAPGGPKFGHRVWALIQVASPESSSSAKLLPVMPAVVPPVEEREDPIIAAVLAAVPPGPVSEGNLNVEAEGEDVMAESTDGKVEEASQKDATAMVEGDSAAKSVQGASAAAEKGHDVVLAEGGSPEVVSAGGPEGYVEVVPAQEVSTAPLPEESVQVDVAPSVEPTTVGNFSIVDMPVPGSGKEDVVLPPDNASIDDFVVAAAPGVEDSAPNGEAMKVGGELEAVKAKKEAMAARELMFDIEDAQEAEILDQLEAMGFEDRELNREALAKAGGNIEAAIESVMNIAEWDGMLAELEEMGFEDKVLNVRMMFKNSGNVKSALKDLVRYYKNK